MLRREALKAGRRKPIQESSTTPRLRARNLENGRNLEQATTIVKPEEKENVFLYSWAMSVPFLQGDFRAVGVQAVGVQGRGFSKGGRG